MTLKQVSPAIYATWLTNSFGFKLKKVKTHAEKKQLRYQYASTLLRFLHIEVETINPEKIPKEGQYLLVSNHRTIIDPVIIEVALKNSNIFGMWISKKELYNSFFFGVFVRNAGSVLLDRQSKQMAGFFKDVKQGVKEGASMFVFPEGTRNQSDKILGEFKDGSQIIAIKNRLSILPVYIHGRPDLVLKEAINHRTPGKIKIEFGDLIDAKDRSMSLQEHYRQRFSL